MCGYCGCTVTRVLAAVPVPTEWGGVTFTFPIHESSFDTDVWFNVKAEGVLSSYVLPP